MIMENFVISDSMSKSFRIFMQLFEKIEKPILILNKNGKILYVNCYGAKLIQNRYENLKVKVEMMEQLVHQ